MYYILFTWARLLLGAVRTTVYVVMEVLNHFPLYTTFVYITDPSFLPGGICFKMLTVNGKATSKHVTIAPKHTTSPEASPIALEPPANNSHSALHKNTSYFVLYNTTMQFQFLFFQIKHTVKKVFQIYTPAKCIKNLLTGAPI